MSKKWADKDDGSFKRQVSAFQETISSQHPVFKPAKNRYWLYVSLACPWAHRTLITRCLKGLTSVIGVSVVHWHMDDKGWKFIADGNAAEGKKDPRFWQPAGGIGSASRDESGPFGEISMDSSRLFEDSSFDPINQFDRISQLYFKHDPNYSARFTVPVLWDTETQRIVSNESAQIIRIFSSGVFDEFVDKKFRDVDLVPRELESAIDEFNGWVYDNINNGVYKAGFAENAAVYEREVTNIFKHLDKVEAILKEKYDALESQYGRDDLKSILAKYYTVGNQLTEADVRLYTTIARFDPVYVQHFKCNFTTIRDGYPHIHLWLKNLYWNHDAFKLTTDFQHIKLHYTRSHSRINPLGITPLGPKPDIGKL